MPTPPLSDPCLHSLFRRSSAALAASLFAVLVAHFVRPLGAAPPMAESGEGFSARLVQGPVKVRPYAELPAASNAPLLCARNEYCSFQVVVSARGEDLAKVDVALSDLTGPAGARILSSQATIYREEFLNVFYRSTEQGDIGEWPDPLIPKVDPEYGEPRNAFPVDVRRISRAYQRYLAEEGRALAVGRGKGFVISGGNYTGGIERRYVMEIVRPGRLGAATFRWRADPGSAQPGPEFPTAREPIALDSGVTAAFRGEGQSDDFVIGDEFWIFAGPFRHQPVWVDVLIPPDAPAGLYSGEVRVTTAGHAPIRLPVEIEVLALRLPSMSTLPNTFMMYWPALAAAHFPEAHSARDNEDLREIELGHLYARAALRNSITIAPSEDLAPVYTFHRDGTLERADYSRYDLAAAEFLDGYRTPRSARWTSLPLPRLKNLPGTERAAALSDYVRHAHARGWFDRLFDYTFDEPDRPEDFAALEARARLVRGIEPGIPRLATTELSARLFGLVTRWCPVVNSLEPKNSSPREWWNERQRPRRENYEARLRSGDSLWWYQSCLSHGCGGIGRSPQFDDWPSYMVDISAAANRVFGLLTAVTYNVSGVLYWDVAYAHSIYGRQQGHRLDVWESIYYFGGNGDGSLFYPGRPAQVGGRRHIPIESLRMKFIRDSFYDADYALMLRRLGEEEFLRREVSGVVQKAWRWDADPRAWAELRRKLGKRLEEKSRAARR